MSSGTKIAVSGGWRMAGKNVKTLIMLLYAWCCGAACLGSIMLQEHSHTVILITKISF